MYGWILETMRLRPDGIPDSSFGICGIGNVFTQPAWDFATSTALQPDGKILISSPLSRLTSDGIVDSSFATNGVVEVNETIHIHDIELQQDGKIITITDSALTRYKNDIATCSANFTLYPDTLMPHHYWALNQATGTAPLSYEWNWGDGTLDTIAFPSHTYSSGGYYNICLTIHDSTGCTNNYCSYSQIQKILATEGENTIVYVDVVPNIPTSTNTSQMLESLGVFPSPAHDRLSVMLTSKENIGSQIIIYDLMSRVVYHSAIDLHEGTQQFDISLSSLKSGAYQLVIRNDHKLWEKGFVKQ
jgi:hypothetical protein